MSWEWLTSIGGYTITSVINYLPNNTPSYVANYNNEITQGNNPLPDYGNAGYRQYSHTWDVADTTDLVITNINDGSSLKIRLYINGETTALFQLNGGGGVFGSDLAIGINHDTEEAAPVWLTQSGATGMYFSNVNVTSEDAGITQKRKDLYTVLMGLIPPLYEWSSVPAISGKNGILSLPMLDTLSWDGAPITNAERDIFTTLPEMANIKSLYDNIVFGQTVPIVYAGDEHVALITWNNATSFTIDYKYNIADALELASITYTLAHAQDDVYFAFVSMISGDPEDPEQQIRWARPSFVIRDAVTGKYSFGIESFNDDSYYPAFYNWHIAGFSADFSIFGDVNGEEGGDGYGDLVDDPIGNPVTPTIGAVATGFTRLYYITGANKDKLTSLMNWFNDPDIQIVNQLF